MDEIKDIIHGIINKLSTHIPARDEELFKLLNRCLDPIERTHIKIAGIKDNSVTVYADSSVWLYQVKSKQRQLLLRIQKEFPEIEKIFFKIGSLK